MQNWRRGGAWLLLLAAVGLPAAQTAARAAEDEGGHGRDYRTFHSDGTIDYGEVRDSYTADLVLFPKREVS